MGRARHAEIVSFFGFIFPLIILWGGSVAWAFPEFVRHHYFACTTCHLSPGGGGVLTGYGRTLSAQLLSTWGDETEASFLHGLVPSGEEDRFFFGGNVRNLQVHIENSKVKRGFPVRMQAGLEFAYKTEKISGAIFVGKLSPDGNIWTPYAPRFWVAGHVSEELLVRAGRFLPNFGLNIPQHRAVTRAGLGFDQGAERDTFEVQNISEFWDFVLGYSQSIEIDKSAEKENAVHAQANRFVAERHRLGASFWSGEKGPLRIRKVSLHGALGYTEQFYQLIEIAEQTLHLNENTRGHYGYTKLGYEVGKGVHGLINFEYKKGDTNDATTEEQSKGLGFAFYPRPHLELEGLFAKRRDRSDNFKDYDYAYLQMHYYF